jgi:hypothetical protein
MSYDGKVTARKPICRINLPGKASSTITSVIEIIMVIVPQTDTGGLV